MFRTDLNHFLQSLDSHAFYRLMEAVSFMGTIYMIMLTILILIAGVNFRKGFLIFNVLGWAVLVMLLTKNSIDYPRPIAVDVTLESFGKEKTQQDLSALQPSGFFDTFSDKLLEKTHASDIGRYGFPSGHVLLITSIWFSMALLIRKHWLWILSISLIVLTMFSRMYLGVHYLGDVLGGLIIGLIVSFSINKLINLWQLSSGIAWQKKHILFFLAPALLILFYKFVPAFQVGGFIGFNLALLVIIKVWQEPVLSSSFGKRVANILIFVILYFSTFFLTRQLPLAKSGFISLVTFIIVSFVVVVVFFYLGRKLRLYKLSNDD